MKRPWGYYETIISENGYKVKRIIVRPGQKISLQLHKHRSEHWTIVKGRGIVQIGMDKHEIGENQSIYIPKETLHRIECTGDTDIVFIEVQVGDYLEEDDIVRIEDDYGRIA